eukprot:g5262.t1
MQWDYSSPLTSNKATQFRLPASCRLFFALSCLQFVVSAVLRVIHLWNDFSLVSSEVPAVARHMAAEAVWAFVTFLLLDCMNLLFAYRTISQANLYDLYHFILFSVSVEASLLSRLFTWELSVQTYGPFLFITHIALSTIIFCAIIILAIRKIIPNIRWLFYKRIGGDAQIRKVYKAWMMWHSTWLVECCCSTMVSVTAFGMCWNQNFFISMMAVVALAVQLVAALAGRHAMRHSIRMLFQTYMWICIVGLLLICTLVFTSLNGQHPHLVISDLNKGHMNQLAVDELHAISLVIFFARIQI